MATLRPTLGLIAICCLVLVLLAASTPRAHTGSSLFVIQHAAKQGYNDAMLLLAQAYKHRKQDSAALLWAQRALDNGNENALSQLLQWYPQNERQWYSKAAQQGSMNAQVFLWHQEGRALTASELQLLASWPWQKLNSQSRHLLAQLLLFQHNSLPTLPHWRALAYTAKSTNHSYWQPLLAGDDVLRRIPTQCDFNLAFSTQRRQAIRSVLRWLNALDEFLLGRGYRLCASQQALLPDSHCEAESGRAFCSTSRLPSGQAISIIVTEQGSANTRNGKVYLNEHASWQVLLHELGHALGLADEYPMAHELAQRFCSGDYNFKARNIVLAEPRILSVTAVEQLRERLPWREQLTTAIALPVAIGAGTYFRLGSSEPGKIGLYTTATCQATRLQAWKPVQAVTFMEQHEVSYVPDLYLQWMAEEMANR